MTMKVQAEIDINAIRSLLQERQLKMMLAHDSSRRAKKARPLVVGERCYVLGPNDKWIDAFVTGTKDSARSYDTQVEDPRCSSWKNPPLFPIITPESEKI